MCLLSMLLSLRKSGSEFQVHNQDSLDTIWILKILSLSLSLSPLLPPFSSNVVLWSTIDNVCDSEGGAVWQIQGS